MDDFLSQLLDTAQLGLDRLELLGGLDGAPVFGVGANVNIELDVARGRVRSTSYRGCLLVYNKQFHQGK